MSESTDLSKVTIPNKLFFKIGEVAELAGVEPYVLRYWETEFSIKPSKSKKQQRLYQRRDIESILRIKKLLYEERYTIEGARKRLKELKKLKQGDQLTLLLDGKSKSAVAVSPQNVVSAIVAPKAESGITSAFLALLKQELLDLKRDIYAS